MVRSLIWRKDFRLICWKQSELCAAVVQRETAALGNDACAKAAVVAADERGSVPIRIGD